jgi:hypothetical protein
MSKEKPLYTLISLENFKALMGVDDREDKTARFCLVTATKRIEQYCMRRFIKRNHYEVHLLPSYSIYELKEYPVLKIISVYSELVKTGEKEVVNPNNYFCTPDIKDNENIPYSLIIRNPQVFNPNHNILSVKYKAGYSPENIPEDLSSACMELAEWNMKRYRGQKIGMTSNVRGKGREGEHFESSMPENVKALLEPYKRKTI